MIAVTVAVVVVVIVVVYFFLFLSLGFFVRMLSYVPMYIATRAELARALRSFRAGMAYGIQRKFI